MGCGLAGRDCGCGLPSAFAHKNLSINAAICLSLIPPSTQVRCPWRPRLNGTLIAPLPFRAANPTHHMILKFLVVTRVFPYLARTFQPPFLAIFLSWGQHMRGTRHLYCMYCNFAALRAGARRRFASQALICCLLPGGVDGSFGTFFLYFMCFEYRPVCLSIFIVHVFGPFCSQWPP